MLITFLLKAHLLVSSLENDDILTLESELSEVFIVERRDRHRFAGTHSGDWRGAYYSTRCFE